MSDNTNVVQLENSFKMSDLDKKYNILDQPTPANAPLSAKFKRSRQSLHYICYPYILLYKYYNVFRHNYVFMLTEVLHIIPFRSVCQSF